MHRSMDNVSVMMARDTLDNLPRCPLPAGFRAALHRPGDEQVWVAIQEEAERYAKVSLDLFRREFGCYGPRLAQRQFFIRTAGGIPVATATAWIDDRGHDPLTGRVHWIAVRPAFQGLGLGKGLLSMVCRRLRELGHRKACLLTATARIPAIALYLEFGFHPVLRDAKDLGAWSEFAAHAPGLREGARRLLLRYMAGAQHGPAKG